MFSRSSMLAMPYLMALWVAYASAVNLDDYRYVCSYDSKHGKQWKGALNPQRQFVPAQGSTPPSGDCKCSQGSPPRFSCETESPIKNSPFPAIGDVYCATDSQCDRPVALEDYRYICVNDSKHGKQWKGALNPQRQFVPAQGSTPPSGDCKCSQGSPPRFSCETESPIKNSPLPAVGDVYCATDNQCKSRPADLRRIRSWPIPFFGLVTPTNRLFNGHSVLFLELLFLTYSYSFAQ
ncbi:hypothetical protein Pst134EA_032579 [Puccinia striiformis f. sp. tritici]|uniref:uncharacterized protein n=1 Tax=Puccinia striiformis f. sp. tritici TaxID=168172 RepID=UPI002007A45E|nr:uncharacterized protein Pst134EA_032579 [Puccinia striiformis f. sp. tritici]KAH9443568.1 hypothetical protein Pst134EA_032579 [Puccinia striiformis f. sp. tritici]